ncbi:angiopoietin-1-like isoform X3 [Drosophila takahashii]
MKTPNVNNLAEEPQVSGSSLESTTDNSFNSDSDAEVLCAATDQLKSVKKCKTNEKKKINDLEERLVFEKEKIRHYEALIRDKDDIIKSLKWIAESEDIIIKQMQSQINDLQNALDLKNPLNITDQKDVFNSSEKPITENINQIQEPNIQDQINLLKLTNAKYVTLIDELELKLKEKEDIVILFESKVAELENQFKKDEVILRAEIAKLEDKAKDTSAEILEKDEQLRKYTSNANNGSEIQPTLLLNFTKNKNIKLVEMQGIDPFMAVFEDIQTAGSDWMVIQRRIDGTVSFSHNSELPCSVGFGNINSEYWIGFDLLHQITNTQKYELYVELVDFDDVTAYARYDNFTVGSKDEKYMLKSLGSYSGNAGDAFRSLEKQTVDKWTKTDKSIFFWWYTPNMQC